MRSGGVSAIVCFGVLRQKVCAWAGRELWGTPGLWDRWLSRSHVMSTPPSFSGTVTPRATVCALHRAAAQICDKPASGGRRHGCTRCYRWCKAGSSSPVQIGQSWSYLLIFPWFGFFVGFLALASVAAQVTWVVIFDVSVDLPAIHRRWTWWSTWALSPPGTHWWVS